MYLFANVPTRAWFTIVIHWIRKLGLPDVTLLGGMKHANVWNKEARNKGWFYGQDPVF